MGWIVAAIVLVIIAWAVAIFYDIARPPRLNSNQPDAPAGAAVEGQGAQRDDADPLPPDDTGPLGYPGRRPGHPAVLLAGRSLLRVHPSEAPVGSWATGGGLGRPVDDVLAGAGAAAVSQRSAVVALGGGAAPARLAEMLQNGGRRPAVPMVAAQVRGIVAGVSAHVSVEGYLPVTPVAEDGAVAGAWVVWPDRDELRVLDDAHPDYRRVRLPPRVQVILSGGRVIQDCWAYVSRHGYLTDRSGRPRELTDQPALIAGLLADVPALSGIAGSSPQDWVRRAAEPAVRDRIRDTLAQSGFTGRQPGLSGHGDVASGTAAAGDGPQ